MFTRLLYKRVSSACTLFQTASHEENSLNVTSQLRKTVCKSDVIKCACVFDVQMYLRSFFNKRQTVKCTNVFGSAIPKYGKHGKIQTIAS